MNYWLVKSEPFKWSWNNQVKKGVEHWNNARNRQANHNMKATLSLAKMALVKQMCLSVGPVTKTEWDIICKMGKL